MGDRVSRRRVLAWGAAVAATPTIGSLRRPAATGWAEHLGVVPRSEWGPGLRPTGPLPAEEVRFLIVHHTAEPGNDYGPNDVPRLLRGIFAYHTSATKGWADIAYNFFVDRFGRIWEGRTGSIEGPVQGSATGGNQGFTQLCCFLGDHATVPPNPEAVTSMTALLAALADRYGIDTSPGAEVQFVSRGSNRWPKGAKVVAAPIALHREMSMTECPGDACVPVVRGEIVDGVRRLRGKAAPNVPPTGELAPPTPPAPSTTTQTSKPSETSTSTSSQVTVAPATSVSSVPVDVTGDERAVPTRPEAEPGGGSESVGVALAAGGVVLVAGGAILAGRRRNAGLSGPPADASRESSVDSNEE